MRASPVIAFGLLSLAAAATAQERSLARLDLPRDVERRLTRVMEDSSSRRFDGNTQIPTTDTIRANVVVLEGRVSVGGRIEGELIVVGGDVDFEPGGTVVGDLTVVGGEAFDLEVADVGGTVTMYGEGFQLYHRGRRVLALNTRRHDDRETDWGRSSIKLRTGINYNRVEGLPVLFGPVIQTSGASPTRIEAYGIVRTGSGRPFDSDQMGYSVRLEQFIGGRTVRLGGTLRSVVEPIESWHLSNLEASLATFVLHDDQRDYFQRDGWGVYARVRPSESPFDASIGYWQEDHSSRASRDPWTLFGNNGWREQPLIAEGRLRSVQGRVVVDTRNNHHFPASGVYVSAQAVHGLSDALTIPARRLAADSLAAPAAPVDIDGQFTSALLDVRMYRRVTGGGTLALRGVAGGSVDGGALPAQFQHALGGAGTLPGYGLFGADCGARRVAVTPAGSNADFFPYYGCDRFVLGSIEYRGGFEFDLGGDFDFWGTDDDDREWHVDAHPNWLVFFNAAQGWSLDKSRSLGGTDTGILSDAGAGITLGDLGVFAAVPLRGEDRGVRFFVRLGARF